MDINKIISEIDTNDIDISIAGELRFSRDIRSILNSKTGKSQIEAVKKMAKIKELKKCINIKHQNME